jgi:hypothetical protein
MRAANSGRLANKGRFQTLAHAYKSRQAPRFPPPTPKLEYG